MPRSIWCPFALCGLVLSAIQPAAVARDATTKPSLVGSWEFTAKPDSRGSDEAEIAGLATCTSDGTATETDTHEAALHLTSGQGIWQPSPAIGKLVMRFTSLAANPDGTLNLKRVVTATVELNPTRDQFSGEYSVDLVDASGHPFKTRSGSVEGHLIAQQSLP